MSELSEEERFELYTLRNNNKNTSSNQPSTLILRWLTGIIAAVIAAGSLGALTWVITGISQNSERLIVMETKNTQNEFIMRDVLGTVKALQKDFTQFSSKKRFDEDDDNVALENFKVKNIDPWVLQVIEIRTIQKDRGNKFEEYDRRIQILENKVNIN